MFNLNASYGRLAAQSITPASAGKVFYVTAAVGTGAAAQFLQDVFKPDFDGISRVYANITDALAACVSGRGDVVVIAADYTTATTDTELSSAGTKGAKIVFAGSLDSSEQIAMTSSKSLPATTTGSLFTITGLVEIQSVVGVVTTVIQTQACNLKLSTVSNGATTDICADLNISANTAQSRYSITGTFANALINTAKGVPVAKQATAIVAQEGTIIATTSATNTGAVRWLIRYKPLQEGARIVAA